MIPSYFKIKILAIRYEFVMPEHKHARLGKELNIIRKI